MHWLYWSSSPTQVTKRCINICITDGAIIVQKNHKNTSFEIVVLLWLDELNNPYLTESLKDMDPPFTDYI